MDDYIKWGPWRARVDWAMAQIVAAALDMLATGADHAKVQAFMMSRLVPLTVQRRVLSGHAKRRHIEKRI